MRAINAVIESIPQPEKPRGDEPPEKPVVGRLPLEVGRSRRGRQGAGSLAADRPLRARSESQSNQRLRDPHAARGGQTGRRTIADRRRAPGEEQTRFEVYQLDDADPQTVAGHVAAAGAQRAVVGRSGQQETGGLGHAGRSRIARQSRRRNWAAAAVRSSDRQVEVYRLKKADPAAALVVLQNIVPKARLSVDAASRSIIALANLADQKTIRATLDQLEPPQGGSDGRGDPSLLTHHGRSVERDVGRADPVPHGQARAGQQEPPPGGLDAPGRSRIDQIAHRTDGCRARAADRRTN